MERGSFENRRPEGSSGRRHGARAGRGGRGHGGGLLEEIFTKQPDAQILFVGSVNCVRHRPFLEIAEYMREGRASLLCPTMTDFASGRYLRQIKEAVKELSMERGAKEFVLMFGCQWVILSSDGELLRQELREELGVNIALYDDSHLENGDHNERGDER